MRNEPDGLIGAVIAAEGCGAKAFINGPGGCRSRALNLWRELSEAYAGEEEGCCRSKFLSRQSHLPCTYLNSDDIVLGSANKIAEGLGSVAKATEGTMVLIDTLGASVQVADREAAAARSGAGDRVVLADPDLSSMPMADGYDSTLARLAAHAGLRGRTEDGERRVCVLGYSIADPSWIQGRRSLTALLREAGADDVVFAGCGCTEEDIARSGDSGLCVLLRPEMSARTSALYRDNGVPVLTPSRGAPIGYDATRSLVREVAGALGTDPTEALAHVDAEEREVRSVLMSSDKDARSLRGYGMSLTGMASEVLPLMRWMYDYFTLVPVSVDVVRCGPSPYDGEMRSFLEGIGCSDALGRDASAPGADVWFGDGLSAAYYKDAHPTAACVGISMPFAEKCQILDRGIMGTGGCRYILDSVINGTGLFRCGQPTMADFR